MLRLDERRSRLLPALDRAECSSTIPPRLRRPIHPSIRPSIHQVLHERLMDFAAPSPPHSHTIPHVPLLIVQPPAAAGSVAGCRRPTPSPPTHSTHASPSPGCPQDPAAQQSGDAPTAEASTMHAQLRAAIAGSGGGLPVAPQLAAGSAAAKATTTAAAAAGGGGSGGDVAATGLAASTALRTLFRAGSAFGSNAGQQLPEILESALDSLHDDCRKHAQAAAAGGDDAAARELAEAEAMVRQLSAQAHAAIEGRECQAAAR
eukprot:351646-Chlamydomonas_euryale.AAC.4